MTRKRKVFFNLDLKDDTLLFLLLLLLLLPALFAEMTRIYYNSHDHVSDNPLIQATGRPPSSRSSCLEGRPGMSDVPSLLSRSLASNPSPLFRISGLSFDSTFCIPAFVLLLQSIATLIFLSCPFFLLMAYASDLYRKSFSFNFFIILVILFVKR